MANVEISYRFPDNTADLIDHRSRGWRQGIIVKLNDGRRFELEAYDPKRLNQDMELEFAAGRVVIAQPHAIVVPEVTQEAIEVAIQQLAQGGWFFEQIASLKK